jgi:hypothetical protein
MKTLMALFILLAPLLTHAKPVTAATNPELKGVWVLAGVDCADHKLGVLAMKSRQALEEQTSTQGFIIDAKGIQYFMDDGKLGKAFCRTSYFEKWDLEGSTLRHTGIKFASRKGIGGYKCDVGFKTDVPQKDYTSGFKLQKDQLILSHPDLQIKDAEGKVVRDCKTGADIQLTYKRRR